MYAPLQVHTNSTIPDYPTGTTQSGQTHEPLAGVTFEFAMSVIAGQPLTDETLIADVPVLDDPVTVEEALQGPNLPHWVKVLEKEHGNLKKHGVYEWVDSGDSPVMDSKMVLCMKRNTDGVRLLELVIVL